MRRSVPIETSVFQAVFPFPGADSNPPSWRQYVKRRLEPEVRAERERFYGSSEAHETIEGKYPGFDYTYWPHRRRLERWPQHKLLFTAMDDLRLTPHEIRELCCWSGSIAEKERYERKNGVTIVDTTGQSAYRRMLCQQRSPLHARCPECRPRFSRRQPTVTTITARPQRREFPLSTRVLPSNNMPAIPRAPPFSQPVALAHSAHLGPSETARLSQAQDSYEGELQSIGLALNQHLMAVAAAFEHGDGSVSTDPDFDIWLKDNEADETVQSEHAPFLHLPSTLPDQISWEASL